MSLPSYKLLLFQVNLQKAYMCMYIILSSTCLCKFPLVQQQMGCGVTVRGVVEVDQGAVEDQVDLQSFTIGHRLKQLVL